jgi:hypothetical protein
LYFYQDRGKWQGDTSHPNWLHLRKDESVPLEMDTDKPYKFHKDVTKRYPRDYRSDHHEGRENEKDEWRGDRSRDRN